MEGLLQLSRTWFPNSAVVTVLHLAGFYMP